MPTFHYRGKRKTGEAVDGEIRARNRDEAIEIVSQQGVLPIAMKEYHPIVTKKARVSRQLSFKEQYIFTRQLSNLIKAGVPILRALEIIQQQTSPGALTDILEKIHQGIRDGKSFSDCLTLYPKEFSALYVAMVRVGEEGGNLRDVLVTIAEHQKRQHELSLKVRTALAYPVLMAGVGAMTVLFILTFVMPKISRLFADLGQQLPLPTRILMQTSKMLVQGWFVFIPAVFLILFLLVRWAQGARGKLFLDSLKLRLPMIGPLLLRVELARFCRTLEMLTKNGISLLRGMHIAIPTLNNAWLREDLSLVKQGLEAGNSLSKSFQSCTRVPSMMVHLIGVGEESGLLEETLHDIADAYEDETAEGIKTLTTLLEPLMILFVGLIVGFIVIAMLLPIFQMDALAR